MRKRRLHLAPLGAVLARLAIPLLLTTLPAAARAQAVGAQPGAGERVSVLFTALGKDGKFVTGLKAEDVRVTADGEPVRSFDLTRQKGVRLFLTVAIDTSASQENLLPSTKVLADLLVRSVMLPGTDEAAVVTFSTDTTLEQGMTKDVARVRRAIARVAFVPPTGYVGGGVIVGAPPLRSAGATGMWDAVWVVSREVMPRWLGPGRRALLLITDGVDTSSTLKSNKAINAALASEIVVYAVGVADEKNFDGVDKDALRKLAGRTGGRAFFPKKIGELTGIFRQIQEELDSQYVVTFAPPSGAREGSFHKIKIEIANPALRGQDVQLTYPQGFFVGEPPTVKK